MQIREPFESVVCFWKISHNSEEIVEAFRIKSILEFGTFPTSRLVFNILRMTRFCLRLLNCKHSMHMCRSLKLEVIFN